MILFLGMQASAPPGSMTQSQPAAFSPMTNFSRPQGDGNYQSNNFTRNTLTMSSLRRPKDYMPQQQARSGSATVSAF
ncbi:hypothetical protein EB796_016477 [Bugula neritina]|uniref:Uncharacterized protein n=1 Tax=Bugula neritina TaxID=10212 RepID=A0A7J7JHY0_BUGNE|nr:hypothetical protein EB796_016477 [Bugula neritina]